MAKKSKELKLDMDAINNQHIIDVDLNSEMKKAYIDYAMSVIVSRALPDVRDGMKPVHRRILYDMYEANLLYENDFKKSYTSYIEKLINIQNENLSSSKKRGAKSIPEKPSISQRIKLKNLLESSGYTLSIPLEYLNSFDVDCIIKYITTQSIDLGDERIYNYVHKSNLN